MVFPETPLKYLEMVVIDIMSVYSVWVYHISIRAMSLWLPWRIAHVVPYQISIINGPGFPCNTRNSLTQLGQIHHQNHQVHHYSQVIRWSISHPCSPPVNPPLGCWQMIHQHDVDDRLQRKGKESCSAKVHNPEATTYIAYRIMRNHLGRNFI